MMRGRVLPRWIKLAYFLFEPVQHFPGTWLSESNIPQNFLLTKACPLEMFKKRPDPTLQE
jgi:hypothetical protein